MEGMNQMNKEQSYDRVPPTSPRTMFLLSASLASVTVLGTQAYTMSQEYEG